MGMFDPNQPSQPDLSTFNYQTQADQVRRQREIANQLLQSKQPQGQMVSGWYVKPSIIANLAPMISSALGAYMSKGADSSQKDLDANSQAALAQQLNGLNSPVRNPDQDAIEAQAQLDREAHRGPPPGSGVEAGQTVSAPEPEQNPDVQTFPMQVGANPADGPATPIAPVASITSAPANKRAAAMLSAPKQAAQAAPPTSAGTGFTPSANFPSDPSLVAPGAWDNLKRIGSDAKTKFLDGLHAVQHFTGADGTQASPTTAPTLPAPTQPAPQAPVPPAAAQLAAQQLQSTPPPTAPPSGPPQAGPPTGALPPMPTTAPPQVAPPAPPQPLPPAMPQPAPTGQPTGPADNPYTTPPTQQQLVARLVALGRTSPEGAQIAQAQLNQMFASKNGRFATDVKADTVNGGFVAVTTDSQTGHIVNVAPIGATGSGKLVTGQTTDASGNRLNVHKDGSTTPMVGADGKPVVDSGVIAKNDEQTMKVANAVQTNQNAQAAIDTAINRNNRILQLYHDTYAGPLGGLLPNLTANRQELHSLLAQDLFSETRNALAGAGDAGGAPRMAQSEFTYMKNNGGLSQTTSPAAAENIIANMNAQLMAQKKAVMQYGEALGRTAPAASTPARGQSVSAAQYGFQ